MKRIRRDSPLWAYLSATGVLDEGEEEIRKAKRKYRAQYLKAYKQNRKGRKKEFSITFDKEELHRLSHQARKHHLTEGTYIKKAALAYANEVFLIPDIAILHHVEQLLLICQTHVERIANTDTSAWYKPDRRYNELEDILTDFHKQIKQLFCQPPPLESEILKVINEKPSYIEVLKRIITEYAA